MSFLLKGSLIHKIGGLSSLLLIFILFLNIYAVVRLQHIHKELKQQAEVDIPLENVSAKLVMLEMQQHIIVEKTQVMNISPEELTSFAKIYTAKVLEQAELLTQLRGLFNQNIIQKNIIDDPKRHDRMLAVIDSYEKTRFSLNDKVLNYLEDNKSKALWLSIKLGFIKSDQQTQALVKIIDDVTEDVAQITEKHTIQFIWVQSALGLIAFFIGILLTIHIIARFKSQLSRINQQINIFSDVVTRQKLPNIDASFHNKGDELSSIVNNINQLMERMSNEIQNRYEVERQLINLAITDELTGAYNRHKWEDVIKNSIQLAERGVGLSMIMIDLDYFKRINDKYGHDVGDKVLVEAVAIIKGQVRQTDLVFRLGGEEFAILLVNTEQYQAVGIAENVRQSFAQYDKEGVPKFTASFGVSEFIKGDTTNSLTQRVDKALYEAKNTGRDNVKAL